MTPPAGRDVHSGSVAPRFRLRNPPSDRCANAPAALAGSPPANAQVPLPALRYNAAGCSPLLWRCLGCCPRSRSARRIALALRQSVVHSVDPYALLAWIRKGELQAQLLHCAPYDPKNFRAALIHIRKLTRDPLDSSAPRMVESCASAGVALVFVPEVPGTRTWGVTHWLTPEKAVIQLSLRGKTDDHFWFTFFHEAAHILLHPKRDIFVEREGTLDSHEREADQFAADSLIPPPAWQRLARAKPRSKVEIETIADQLDIAPGIIVGRLQREKLLPWTNLNALKRKLAF